MFVRTIWIRCFIALLTLCGLLSTASCAQFNAKPDTTPAARQKKASQADPFDGKIETGPTVWKRRIVPGWLMGADRAGSVYVLPSPGGLAKYGADGERLWQRDLPRRLSSFLTNRAESKLYGFSSTQDRIFVYEIDREARSKFLLRQAGDSVEDLVVDDRQRPYFLTRVPNRQDPPGKQRTKLLLAAYRSKGDELWSVDFQERPEQSVSKSLAVGSGGRLYVLSAILDPAHVNDPFAANRYTLSQYRDGKKQWTVNPPSLNIRGGSKIIADRESVYHIIQIGHLLGSNEPDVTRVTKYDGDGRELWTKDLLPAPVGARAGEQPGFVLNRGNLYFVNVIGAPDSAEQYVSIVKLEASGELIWEKRLMADESRTLQLQMTDTERSSGADHLRVDGLHVDDAGNVYFGVHLNVSIFEEVFTHSAFHVFKLNNTGDVTWTQTLKFKYSVRHSPVARLAVDPKGDVYAGGTYTSAFREAYDHDDAGFLIKYRP